MNPVNKTNKRTWHSTANPSQSQLGGFEQPTGKKRRYIPTKEKIREMAHESTDGGTAYCEYCHTTFAMYYMRLVRMGAFKKGFACVDCVKANNLDKVK